MHKSSYNLVTICTFVVKFYAVNNGPLLIRISGVANIPKSKAQTSGLGRAAFLPFFRDHYSLFGFIPTQKLYHFNGSFEKGQPVPASASNQLCRSSFSPKTQLCMQSVRMPQPLWQRPP